MPASARVRRAILLPSLALLAAAWAAQVRFDDSECLGGPSMLASSPGLRVTLVLILALPAVVWAVSAPADDGWIDLSGLDAWRKPTGQWKAVGGAGLDPKDSKHLVGEPGTGAIINDPPGRTTNLVSKESFGDVEVHLEFNVPKGSNSGLKLAGLYEVQIFDSFGKAQAKATDCGGIYPRAELLPNYHYLDDGYPPKVNASKAPGEWQTLDVAFRAPRFDEAGKKVANARFVRVVLNGRTVQEDVEVPCPTGHAWHNAEAAAGPLLLQADHGPVAFRNIRARPLKESDAPSR